MNNRHMLLLAMLAIVGRLYGQTLVDLRTQSKNIDFSSAASTRPAKVGSNLPATCQVGELFFLTSAVAGTNLYGCTVTNAWALQSGGGSGSGSGASSVAQLSDFNASVTNVTTITVGSKCATAMPCNVRIGNTTYSYASPSTVKVTSAGSGMIYIFIDSLGRLTAGSTLALTCAGCSYVSGTTSFPADSIPLYSWTVTYGQFDANGGADFRALLNTKNIVGGAGLQVSENAGNSTIAIDPTLVALRVAVPAVSSTTCSAGQFAFDASFYYVCVNANSWKRFALGSF